MTITQFIKRLQKLRDKHGNVKVCVDYDSLNNGNDTFTIINIRGVEYKSVRQVDGDGFGIINKNGAEREHACAVIKG